MMSIPIYLYDILITLHNRWLPLYDQLSESYLLLHTGYHITVYVPEIVEPAFIYYISITIFFGVFCWAIYRQYNAAKKRIRQQQHQINILNTTIEARTRQLSMIRQTLARDFHDETGNMLSAIMRQADLLRSLAKPDERVQPLIANIILNSEHLYTLSRDFLWRINHDSDNPDVLFDYLTTFGQHFYDQFNMAFSVRKPLPHQRTRKQLFPFVARHVIYIFKEAMTNAAKHSGANEVVFEMIESNTYIRMLLTDNGQWKMPDNSVCHSGLTNMKKRSLENKLIFNLCYSEHGTQIQLTIPIS